MLNTILKSIDTNVFLATTSSSIMLTLTGMGLKVTPKSSSKACGISNCNKVICEMVLQN